MKPIIMSKRKYEDRQNTLIQTALVLGKLKIPIASFEEEIQIVKQVADTNPQSLEETMNRLLKFKQ